MEAVLDSSFIISCIKKKIPFFEQLKEKGFKIVLPREVEQELKDLRFNVAHEERTAIDLALELFISQKIKKMTLGKRTVDEGLINLGKKGAYIATLDVAIKRSIPNCIFILDAQKSIGIERK